MRTYIIPFVKILTLSIVAISCSNDDDVYEDVSVEIETSEQFPGGATTVFDTSGNAFEFGASNLTVEDDIPFFTGNSFFEQAWVAAPASTTARDGLGPFFNARACATCHLFDGRGRVPEFDGEVNHGLLLRLKTATLNEFGAQIGDPIYGGQLQDQSLTQLETEGSFVINYEDKEVEYPDGTLVTLRDPTYQITNLVYGDLDPSVVISPRIANQMIGLGLLEAIEEEDILANVDENDTDNDGISGRINEVYDFKNNQTVMGRFGWKANEPNIEQQVAGAFLGDLGLTTSIFSQENCTTGADCSEITNGNTGDDDFEVSDVILDRVVFYSSTLAVPARRNFDDEDIVSGKQLFFEAQCVSCHIPKYTTGSHSIAALENQTIYPYTDLLLHDMGTDLADNIGDYLATGQEWRTPPLWGIGLFQAVNNHTQLLHDGRARNVEEAILWHGGEAEASKLAFMNFSATERQLVIDFINSL